MSQNERPRTLAVIPARGGSKGVPRKNLTEVAGRSLLARAIGVGHAAESVDVVVVSTDDDEIAEAATALDARVVDRPTRLAEDTTPTPPVILHALESIEGGFGYVVVLQPPAPLRTPADVDAAVHLLTSRPELDAVVSVYQVGDNHPGRMYRLEDAGILKPLHPELERQRRQDLPPVYHRNGAIYCTRVESLVSTGDLLSGQVGAYVMPAGWAVNIDTPDDLPIAEVVVARWDQSLGLLD
jgi:N-acylneuraminate cytidylyltransferase